MLVPLPAGTAQESLRRCRIEQSATADWRSQGKKAADGAVTKGSGYVMLTFRRQDTIGIAPPARRQRSSNPLTAACADRRRSREFDPLQTRPVRARRS